MNIAKINTLLFHDRTQIFEKNIKKIIDYITELKKIKQSKNLVFQFIMKEN